MLTIAGGIVLGGLVLYVIFAVVAGWAQEEARKERYAAKMADHRASWGAR